MPRRRDNTSRGRGPYLFSDFDCPQALRNGDHANKSHIEQSQSQNYGGVKRQKICLAVPGGLGTGWRTAIFFFFFFFFLEEARPQVENSYLRLPVKRKEAFSKKAHRPSRLEAHLVRRCSESDRLKEHSVNNYTDNCYSISM